MKIPLFFAFLCTSVYATAGLLLDESDVFEWAFALSPNGSQEGTMIGGMGFSPENKLTENELITLALYEDEFDESSFYEFTCSGSPPSQPDQLGLIGILLDIAQYDAFIDGDGFMRLTMNEGSVIIESISIVTAISGTNYSATIRPIAIPEPTTGAAILAWWALVPLCRLRKTSSRTKRSVPPG